MEMQGVSAIVTGGASGLGQATAHALAAAGAHVVAVDLAEASAAPGIVPVVADVTDEAAFERAVAVAVERGPLGIVVHCAGIVWAGRIVGRNGPHSLEQFRRVIEVNLIGTFNVLRLTAAAMQQNAPNAEGERGVIVVTSSIAAFEGQIGQAAYAASKGGVASLVLPAARELAAFGIRVVGIAPGVFATPMGQQIPDEIRHTLSEQTPFPKRLGHPDEFAALAMHIIRNPMLNGTVIRLDGGLRMPPR